MKGTKRFAISDSNPETNDAAFRNKRIMAGSPFDAYRAEPSQQPPMTPALDIHRAESSRKHVRALNIQFASWVQTQLKNHPDELWEDGVQDYLAHASNIMEKFSDVVNWLKANAAKGVNLPAVGSFAAEKKLLTENNNNEIKLSQEKTTFNPVASTTSFASPWSSGVFSNSQPPMASTTSSASPWSSGVFSNSQPPMASTTSFASPWSSGVFSNSQPPMASTKSSGVFSNSQPPVLFGSQSLATAPTPTNRDASDDVDGENDLEQPSSPSVKKSEEKGIIVVHEVKCKLYVKSSDGSDKDTWKDKGTGQLSIKCKEGVSKGTKESKPTIVVRNDVGKVLLNALLYPGIKTNTQKNSVVAIFHTSGDNGGNDGGNSGSVVARTFLIRTKTEEDRNKLATAIQEYAPAS